MKNLSFKNHVLTIIIAILSLLSFNLPVLAGDKTLVTIIFTNDTHNRLVPFDVKDLKDVGGIARRTIIFNQIRKENPNTLVIDAGDTLQGTPLYSFFKGEIDFWAMSMAGYDAMVVGNHDIDDGFSNLRKQSQYAAFPILCANVTDKDDLLIFRPYHIFRFNNVRVAVIGLIGLPAWQSAAFRYTKDFKFHDPVEVANKLVPIVRQYADFVVLLTHNGYKEDIELAEKVNDVDVIIGGHTHTKVDEPVIIKKNNKNGINGTLMMQASYGGIYVGRIDLTLNENKIDTYKGKLIPVIANTVTEDNEIDKKISTYTSKIDKIINEEIGEVTQALSIDNKYAEQCQLGTFVTDIIREKMKADVAIVNSGGLREELPKGIVTVGEIYKIMPFDNALVVFDWSGKRLKEMVEENAKRLGKHKTFQFSGLTYKLSNDKVVSIDIGNKPLDVNKKYKVVTVDFVFSGNEDFIFVDTENVQATNVLLRDLIIEYFRKHKKL